MIAELYIYGGTIYTMEEDFPTVEAVAISGDRIIYAGSHTPDSKYIGPSTRILYLEGKSMYPGFVESHVHIPGNAYNVLYNLDLSAAGTVDEILEAVRHFIEANPDKKEYFGRGFNGSLFPGEEKSLGPKKERLDEICRDKPIALSDFGGHIRWLNSEAFRKYGITADTEVEGGVIETDPRTGQLWGTIKEEARFLVPDPSFTHKEKKKAFLFMQSLLNKFGYTTIMGLRASASPDPLPMYPVIADLEKKGKLTMNIAGSREIKVGYDTDSQIKDLLKQKETYDSNLLNIHIAKFFVDGTVEAATAYLLSPYEPAAKQNPGYTGEVLWDRGALTYAMKEAMRHGLDIHVHAIGDGAVRFAVDALEEAQAVSQADPRNTITHLQLVSEKDKKRMADARIIGCVNPYWQYKDKNLYDTVELPFLGKDRAESEYPLASLLKAGMILTTAADHPITPEPNPFYAIQAGVTRNFNNPHDIKKYGMTDINDPAGLLGKEERVSVHEMLKTLTINGAYALRMEDQIGSIRPGKYADLIITEQDLYKQDPLCLCENRVLKVIFHGRELPL